MKVSYKADNSVDTAKAVEQYLKTSHNINAQPQLTADWNLNLYVGRTAENTPTEEDSGCDPDVFPISSICGPFRPRKGIAKALAGQSFVSPNYSDASASHFYLGGADDPYKYWVSPFATDTAGVFPLHTDGVTSCRPTITYEKVIKPNKIVLKFENTWASPGAYRVRIQSTIGGAWSTIASNVAPDKNGFVTLYYGGSSWSASRPVSLVQTNVAALRLEVDTMVAGRDQNNVVTTYTKKNLNNGTTQQLSTNGSKSNLSLISMEPRIEYDLTSYLISNSDNFDMSEKSQLYPIGTTISSTADISLSNSSNLFNNDNTNSPFYGLLGENVEFRLRYVYTVGGQKYYVNQFKMFTDEDTWSGQFTDEVSITLTDQSKMFKKWKPLPMLIENRKVTEIIWRLCDHAGFNDYVVNKDFQSDYVIPVFWTDGEKTFWEVFDDLSTSLQVAIYIDGDGYLRVKTSRKAFENTTPAWTASGSSNASKLADIMSASPEDESVTNTILVKYANASWKVGTNGEPALSRVWEPEEETLVVRSAQIQRDILSNSSYIWITPANALIWPYASRVNIDGEVLDYEGKQFKWFTYTTNVDANGVKTYTNPVANTAFITSHAEYLEKHNSTPGEYQSKNTFTGALKITAREVWNTTMRDHSVDAAGWNKNAVMGTNTVTAYGMKHDKTQSIVNLAPNPARIKNKDHFYTMWRGNVNDTPFQKYGTRIRIRQNSARPNGVGGMHFSLSGSGMAGYYVEIRPTSTITTAMSKTTSEVMVYSKKGEKFTQIGRSKRVAVLKDTWYDLEATYSRTSPNNHLITVWLNGVVVLRAQTNATTSATVSGQYGLYAKAKSDIDFEYYYGVTRAIDEPEDDFGFYDLVYGGLRSGYWQREFVYERQSKTVRMKNKRSKKIYFKKNNYFFDEFGPYMHEVKKFNVSFDPTPVQMSEIFHTNEWYSLVLDYRSTPFGAEFWVCNVSRKNAVIHGEDTLIYRSAENAVNQVCNVLGRDLVIGEEKVITLKNQRSIDAVGISEVELSANWIQTDEAAKGVGQWISEHWSSGRDSLNIDLFGNPLIEIGDVVSIDYSARFMTPATHKYFVVGVQNSWSNGLTTTLSLRRVSTTPASDITVE